ncbi:GLPGLI family protein [Weeksellaceae bacterium KMM 9724]|uniref:GLPGLI family protein n=1 Tax=Profundicola chukchiensis TaxID=2961959 RepID=UPI00243B0782|nr:GLPGLI family protein [Profundicola chukchiensis]MDG4950033.1 GLPGLI family protein [Profundicola chukchiensis]
MKIKVVIIIIFLSVFGYSQTTKAIYDVRINRLNYDLSIQGDYELILSNNLSIFQPIERKPELRLIHYDKAKILWEKENLVNVNIKAGVSSVLLNDLQYKNYKEDTILSRELLLSNIAIVGEKLNKFKWELAQGNDTIILGFNCQKAYTNYRGRTYNAYFTTELNTLGGPWKFDGLPGFILSVSSTDQYFSLNAIKIETKKESTKIQNPFTSERVFSFDEYVSEMKARYEKQFKAFHSLNKESDEGGTFRLEFSDFIEDLGIGVLEFNY